MEKENELQECKPTEHKFARAAASSVEQGIDYLNTILLVCEKCGKEIKKEFYD